MMKLIALATIIITAAGFSQNKSDASMIPENSRQLITVLTGSWDDFHVKVSLLEKRGTDTWVVKKTNVTGVIGKNGLAWGRGIGEFTSDYDAYKKEGDGKSPAGLFYVNQAFGCINTDEAGWINLPYMKIFNGIECVDDPGSEQYNLIVDKSDYKQPDWNSSERMHRLCGNDYKLGFVIEHNTSATKQGSGSCIFLHIWDGPEIPTIGCTAVSESNIRTILEWLDPAESPVILQLPEGEYKKIFEENNLPGPEEL